MNVTRDAQVVSSVMIHMFWVYVGTLLGLG